MNIEQQTQMAAERHKRNYTFLPSSPHKQEWEGYTMEVAYNSFKEGAQWERQRDKWISVEDALPKAEPDYYRSAIVILLYKNGKISFGFYDHSFKLWNGFESNVIAWQPLPEPPKK